MRANRHRRPTRWTSGVYVAVAALATACVSTALPVPDDHPASSKAATAPRHDVATVLDADRGLPPLPSVGAEHGHHGDSPASPPASQPTTQPTSQPAGGHEGHSMHGGQPEAEPVAPPTGHGAHEHHHPDKAGE